MIRREDAPVLVVEARRQMELCDIDVPADLEAVRSYLENGEDGGFRLVATRRVGK